MDFSNKLFIPPIIILTLTLLTISVTSSFICISSGGNYTQGSTYSSNLDTSLSSLLANLNDTGFSYASFGLLERVDAYVMCRADLSLGTCKECTEAAISETRSSFCPNEKQALNWQDNCVLRYSSDNLYGKLELGNMLTVYNVNNASNPTEFNRFLGSLLDHLGGIASKGGDLRKVAAGKVAGPDFQIIFAMVQCKPDLSSDDCRKCLIEAIRYIDFRCNGRRGCRVLLESCFLWYEDEPFFNETRIQELSMPLPPPELTVPPPPSPPGNNTRTIIIVVLSVVGSLVIILLIIGWFVSKRRTKKQRRESIENWDEISTVDSLQYDFGKIRYATNDFSDENKLGQGGFGAVYKGKLQNGQEIAVKRLSKNSGQGDQEFKNEVLLLARLQHRNLVRLLGFAIDGEEKLLVYEFVVNASLDQFIFDSDKRSHLNWDRRSKIIGGIARGLLYLHEDSRLRIIHRDLKPSNILLDREMNPKIADFGMARLFVHDDQTQGTTSRIVGTYGYMAPEYVIHGQFSIKSDVFSFGVLLLEIVSGQKNNYFHNHVDGTQDLLSSAWISWQEGNASDIIDPILKSTSGSMGEILRCIHIGFLCVQENVTDRPTMASVVLMLSSLSLTLAFPSKPAFFARGNDTTGTHDARSESDERKLIKYSSEKSIRSKNDASISELYPR